MIAKAWRCFVAVPLPAHVRAALLGVADSWQADPASELFRPVPPDRWHLTLAFLGDVDPARVPAMAEAVRDVTSSSLAIPARLSGVGAFPDARSARVVWVGVDDPSARLAELVDTLRRSLGVDDIEPFRGHVTLARARRGAGDVRAALQRIAADVPAPAFSVDRVDLLRSHVGASARYETLAATALAGVPVPAGA